MGEMEKPISRCLCPGGKQRLLLETRGSEAAARRESEAAPLMSGPRLLGGLSRARSKPVLTGRAEFEQLLRRKSAWLQDVKKHPLVLGVPLGRNGGPDKAISVDLGMKNMAQISTRELANSSSEFKQALLDRTKGGPLEGQPEDLRRAEPIPMSVLVKEDVMRLPIAAPVRALSPHSSTRALRIQRHRPAHFACGARRCTRPALLGK